MRISVFFSCILMGVVACSSTQKLSYIDASYGGNGKDGARALVFSHDGGFVLGGWYDRQGVHSDSLGLVIKVDSAGKLLWQTVLETHGHNQVSAIIPRTEGGYLAALEEFHTEGNTGQVILTEVSEGGKILGQHSIGGLGSDVADKIRQTSDGGYILIGESQPDGADHHDAWIAKLSPKFDIEWQWRKGTPGRDRFNDAVLLADGSIVASGNATRAGVDGTFKETVPWVVKLDSNGLEIWSQKPELADPTAIRGIASTSDGGFVLSGYSRAMTNGGFDSWIGKTTHTGELVWHKSLDFGGNDFLHSVISVAPLEYVAVGVALNSKANNDASIVHFSEDGLKVMSKLHPKPGDQEARGIVQVNTGAIFLGGANNSEDGSNQQFWLTQTDLSKIQEPN